MGGMQSQPALFLTLRFCSTFSTSKLWRFWNWKPWYPVIFCLIFWTLGWVARTLSSTALVSPIPSATVAKYSHKWLETAYWSLQMVPLILRLSSFVLPLCLLDKRHECLIELTRLALKLSGLLFPICPYCLSPESLVALFLVIRLASQFSLMCSLRYFLATLLLALMEPFHSLFMYGTS